MTTHTPAPDLEQLNQLTRLLWEVGYDVPVHRVVGWTPLQVRLARGWADDYLNGTIRTVPPFLRPYERSAADLIRAKAPTAHQIFSTMCAGVIRAAGLRCQVCNSQAYRVHYRTYDNVGTAKEEGDLIAVCVGCFEMCEERRKKRAG
jgi:hypothetical protein